ncbi:hypothetical protein [Amycolatopsis sp. WQ 127309]|uniref:hypothetical protein n=1 Tax=Amycolatopsis sp. WQ 127309 TaxID=2932773 RepID=UPI001FF5FF11|nr:hypothetical protein [Amycolatopsis sp. WQ 127309]UOZ08302.1 hypothetical protein MUY22_08510 [Amycolatopsis sp. WQ 127309]
MSKAYDFGPHPAADFPSAAERIFPRWEWHARAYERGVVNEFEDAIAARREMVAERSLYSFPGTAATQFRWWLAGVPVQFTGTRESAVFGCPRWP